MAVSRGQLRALDGSVACVDCGNPAVHYDHRDYDHPLEVEPVCQSCNIRRGAGANGDDSNTEPTRISSHLARQLRELGEREGHSMRWLMDKAVDLLVEEYQQRGIILCHK